MKLANIAAKTYISTMKMELFSKIKTQECQEDSRLLRIGWSMQRYLHISRLDMIKKKAIRRVTTLPV